MALVILIASASDSELDEVTSVIFCFAILPIVFMGEKKEKATSPVKNYTLILLIGKEWKCSVPFQCLPASC